MTIFRPLLRTDSGLIQLGRGYHFIAVGGGLRAVAVRADNRTGGRLGKNRPVPSACEGDAPSRSVLRSLAFIAQTIMGEDRRKFSMTDLVSTPGRLGRPLRDESNQDAEGHVESGMHT